MGTHINQSKRGSTVPPLVDIEKTPIKSKGLLAFFASLLLRYVLPHHQSPSPLPLSIIKWVNDVSILDWDDPQTGSQATAIPSTIFFRQWTSQQVLSLPWSSPTVSTRWPSRQEYGSFCFIPLHSVHHLCLLVRWKARILLQNWLRFLPQSRHRTYRVSMIRLPIHHYVITPPTPSLLSLYLHSFTM